MSNVGNAIRKIGEDIIALSELFDQEGSTTAEKVPIMEEKPVEKTPLPKLEDVRAVLAEISRKGKTAEMKELLTKFGATKLSEIASSDYPALLAAAKEVQDA